MTTDNRSTKKFDEWTPGAVDAAQDEQRKSKVSKFWTPAQGVNVIRYLPALPGRGQPFVVTYEHTLERQLFGGKRDERFPCPRKLHKQPCPACTLSLKWAANGNPADASRAEELEPGRRIMGNVHLRADPESLCKVHAFTPKLYEQYLAWGQAIEKGGAGIDFTHPIRGVDILLTRTGSTMYDTRYNPTLDPRGAKPLADDVADMDAILDARVDLAKYTVSPTAHEITELLQGRECDWRRSGGQRTLPAGGGVTAADLLED